MECLARSADNGNQVIVRWSKDGGPLSPRAREQNGVLTISPVTASDTGRYVCTAYYNGQSVNSYAQLQVLPCKFHVSL